MTEQPAPRQERANPSGRALEGALRLASRRVPCFPCLVDKRPACATGFKAATTDAAVLRQLWSPAAVLVGVPTGELSGIFALDIDSAKHPEATEWLERNSRRLPTTRKHRTRSGGLHLLFKHRAGLRNSASKLAPGVDTRGDGGFIIWWTLALGLADHEFKPIAALPDWLLAELSPPPPQPTSPLRRPITSAQCATGNSIRGILRVVTDARPGERNNALHWAACRFGELVRNGRMREGLAYDLLINAGLHTGLSHHESARTARSGLDKGLTA